MYIYYIWMKNILIRNGIVPLKLSEIWIYKKNDKYSLFFKMRCGMLKIDQFYVNKDRSFSTILCFENYINTKISLKDLLRDEEIFLWIKNDAFHVISCQFLHFDEFYTLSYLYRVKLGSMSKFHKSCLSASLKWDTLIFEKIM